MVFIGLLEKKKKTLWMKNELTRVRNDNANRLTMCFFHILHVCVTLFEILLQGQLTALSSVSHRAQGQKSGSLQRNVERDTGKNGDYFHFIYSLTTTWNIFYLKGHYI